MKKTTIKDIATKLGISYSTVSRALADHPEISEFTKTKVKKTAELLNYSVNLKARHLRTKKSQLIALILPNLNNFFSPGVISGINEILDNENYYLLTFLSNNKLDKEIKILKHCYQMGVDGILMSLSIESLNLDHLINLKNNQQIPTILIDKVLNDKRFTRILIDDENLTKEAVNYLVDNKYTNIIGFFDQPELNLTQNRIRGFKFGVNENNAKIEESKIIILDKDEENNIKKIKKICEEIKHKTAIFTQSDNVLSKVWYELKDNGINIPNQLGIITISDGQLPRILHPKITYYNHSGYEIGILAAKKLLEQIKTNNNTPSDHKIKCNLVEQNSINKE